MEDRIDGVGNFVPCKSILVIILEKNELWDEVVNSIEENPIIVPASNNAQALVYFNKIDIKYRRIILGAIKYHVTPHILCKYHQYKMWDALTNLFQS